jgi:protein-S-isoprenylcysteine O-methyltransferase Ste14
MDSARYYVALLALVVYPPVVLFWFFVHPLTGFWRRRGPAVTYTLNLSVMAVIAVFLYRFKELILAREYGTNWILVAGAAAFMLAGTAIESKCRRHLTISTLVGIPQLKADQPGKLLTEGIYSKIRHPRYVGAFLGVVSVALFVNYFAIYLLAALLAPGLYIVTMLEEKELEVRFGREFIEYRNRVPRFVPWG